MEEVIRLCNNGNAYYNRAAVIKLLIAETNAKHSTCLQRHGENGMARWHKFHHILMKEGGYIVSGVLPA